MALFTDRLEAGRQLARKLLHLSYHKPVVLALPRGGIPVAYEIAKELGAPLNVLFVKKIGAPGNAEFAIGALPETGKAILHHEVIRRFGFDENEIQRTLRQKQSELKEQSQKYRAHCPAIPLKGRLVILVDDGLATGATMEAAIEALKTYHPQEIVVAVPVAARGAIRKVQEHVKEIVVVEASSELFSVGAFYRDFGQVTDTEALEFLKKGHGREDVEVRSQSITIRDGRRSLAGELRTPANARALIIFAHGSGSTHQSPRNLYVAKALNALGFSTLLFDLLTPSEQLDRKNVFDIHLLTRRLLAAREWTQRQEVANLPVGYFGASTGAAAALSAAAESPDGVFAVVSRGGRADMCDTLENVQCPVLLIVGGQDSQVIQLNREALAHLKDAKMVLVPGAGHIFEEPGALEKVSEHAMSWFTQSLNPVAEVQPAEMLTQELQSLARPVNELRGLDDVVKRCAQARIVMLGEATHGTQEFYELRRLISGRLIKEHGFSLIAVEGDWPDCQKLNQYIRTGLGGSARKVMHSFSRWPTWMWANEETVQLIEWLRKTPAGFYGLDVYSLFESLDVVKRYLEKMNPEYAKPLADRYGCLESFSRDEMAYAKSLTHNPIGCEEEVVSNLRELLRVRLEEQSDLNAGEIFDLQQNARIIKNAEAYYRAMLEGGPQSWNLRDMHMLDTLDALLKKTGGRAIVWAHNTHVGDYHATEMVDGGYINLGGLAREKYGMSDVCLVGFGTYQGKVLAGRAWGAPAQVMDLPPAPQGTYESYFHEVAARTQSEKLFINFDSDSRLGPMARTLGHRAVGVVYRPELESRSSNYVPTSLAKRYDAFIYVDSTHELKPVTTERAQGMIPETWPGGQ